MAVPDPAGRWDAVIAGGGASGLSLACHLAAGGWRDRSVLVVDDGSRDLDPRAWAYGSREPDLLGDAVDRTFDRLRLRSADRAVEVRLDRYRYRVVTGARLRRAASGLLAGAPGFRLVRGHVDGVEDRGTGALVRVDGRPVRTGWAFDSVTSDAGADPAAWLTFTGWEVETPADAFDPAVPILMDFRTGQDGDVRFVYVLPSSARRALVEHTRFGTAGPADGDAALHDYLSTVLPAAGYRVRRREGGRLPLVPAWPAPARRRVVRIGVPGGMLKASTGYAWSRIQRHSAAIARSLARGEDRVGSVPGDRRHAFLDQVLLDVLVAEPDRLEAAFLRLFARNPGDRVLRFLDEDTSLGQEALLVATLPPAPFLRAMARRLLRR